MARRVFFSFHYEKDVWRVNVVRNSWVTKPNIEEAGYIDAAEFEEIKRQGELAIKRWIDSQLEGTSVTVVLIGTETYSRDWVRYEIIKSFDRGNGLLGVYIHQIKDQNGSTSPKGKNPFEYLMLSIDNNGKARYYERDGYKWKLFDRHPNCSLNFDKKYWGWDYKFSSLYEVYDWVDDNGYNNIGNWIERAARQAGR